ncbi:MAG TPA: DUF4390 domain-containing protein [Burkholderiaceae bacterium]|nr:DUF4390 domain-containing protein [Burkholderiaceae bacterium]
MPSSHAAAHQSKGSRAAWGSASLRAWAGRVVALLGLALAQLLQPAAAQGVDVLALAAARGPEGITVEYQLRVALPRAAEEAVQRGVPLYFAAQATLWRNRWYWRDERVARVRREWRLSYQPLTSTWRVSQGGLGQSHATLAEALASIANSTGWRLADAAAVDVDSRYYVEFDWALDTAQLPRPLQIGLTGIGAASEWALGVERTLRLTTEPK